MERNFDKWFENRERAYVHLHIIMYLQVFAHFYN